MLCRSKLSTAAPASRAPAATWSARIELFARLRGLLFRIEICLGFIPSCSSLVEFLHPRFAPAFLWNSAAMHNSHRYAPRAYRVAFFAQNDHFATHGALRRLVGRGIRQLLEVVFVRPEVDVHLGVDVCSARWALLPRPRMPFGGVVAAQRVSAMIARTTGVSVREQHVLVFVIADPLIAALGLGQPRRLAAEAASRLWSLGRGASGARLSSAVSVFCSPYDPSSTTMEAGPGVTMPRPPRPCSSPPPMPLHSASLSPARSIPARRPGW